MRRLRSIDSRIAVPALLATAVVAFAASAPDTGENWAEKVARAEHGRDARVSEIRSVRRYVLHNPRWEHDAVMTVMVTQDASGRKHYEVLDQKAEGLQKQVLSRILDGEVEIAQKGENSGEINPANYQLTPLRREVLNGRECLVVDLQPRKKSKFLLEGQAWIDIREAAPVRVAGRPSKSLGFWVGKPYIVQDFRKVGDFWLTSQNHSTADVKLLGKTELTVDFLDYSVSPKRGTVQMACTRACSPHLLD